MRICTIVPAIGLLAAAGCGVNLPDQYPLSSYTKSQLKLSSSKEEAAQPLDIHPAALGEIAAVLEKQFGTPDYPHMRKAYRTSNEQKESVLRGAELYHRHCIHCHGLSGDGNGPTAAFLNPKPRDYRLGFFKWKSTTYNDKPTHEDLMRVLADGALGTSMPPFRLMPEQDRKDLVEYVIFLSKRGELERTMLYATASDNLDDVFKQTDTDDANKKAKFLEDLAVGDKLNEIQQSWENAKEKVFVPPSTAPTYAYGSKEYNEAIERGLKLYKDRGACLKCHGADGTSNPDHPGNGISPEERAKFIDDWGNKNPPRDLTLGLFRGGRRPVDLYRRISVGIKGSAMPAGDKLQPNEVWDLVNFVRSLPTQKQLLALPPMPASGEHASAAEH